MAAFVKSILSLAFHSRTWNTNHKHTKGHFKRSIQRAVKECAKKSLLRVNQNAWVSIYSELLLLSAPRSQVCKLFFHPFVVVIAPLPLRTVGAERRRLTERPSAFFVFVFFCFWGVGGWFCASRSNSFLSLTIFVLHPLFFFFSKWEIHVSAYTRSYPAVSAPPSRVCQ